jgi:hypothetical protein
MNEKKEKTDSGLSDADRELIHSVAMKFKNKGAFPERTKAAKKYLKNLNLKELLKDRV